MNIRIENEGTLNQNIFCENGLWVYSWYNGDHNEIGWGDENYFLCLNREELLKLKEMIDLVVEKIV